MTDKEMAEKWVKENCDDSLSSFRGQELQEAFLAGLKAQKEKMKDVSKTSYIKGIRTMANALKEYDRTEGAWTDYFEHKVDETLKMLLKKGVIKESLTTERSIEHLTEAKDLIKNIIRVTWGEGWNYSLDWKVKAEEFLKEAK